MPEIRPRFTVRWLMIAVAVVALGLGYRQAIERWRVFRSHADYHEVRRFAWEAVGEEVWACWDNTNPEIDALVPEPPPISTASREAYEPSGARSLADYHARMGRYWRSRW